MDEVDHNLTNTEKLKLHQLTIKKKRERSTMILWQVLLKLAEQYSDAENELVKAYEKRVKEIMSDLDLDDITETDMDDHDNITVNELDGLDDVEQNEWNNP